MKRLWLYIKIFFQALYCVICDESVNSKGKQMLSKSKRKQAKYDAEERLIELKNELSSLTPHEINGDK